MAVFTIPVAFVVEAGAEVEAAKRVAKLLGDHVPGDRRWVIDHLGDYVDGTAATRSRALTDDQGDEAGQFDLDCWWLPNHPAADGGDGEGPRLAWVPDGFAGQLTPTWVPPSPGCAPSTKAP